MKYETKRITRQTTLNGISFERYDDNTIRIFNPESGKDVEIPPKYRRSAIRFILSSLK